MQGKLILNQNLAGQKNEINLTGVASGIYNIILKSSTTVSIYKILIFAE